MSLLISIFDVTGPVMIGPSSSHTAGAARLSRVAALIVGAPFSHVSFGLHGSFAKTYRGHGTDKALVAGALGFDTDDEHLADAFSIAAEKGLDYDFYETELDGMHDNSVCMEFTLESGETRKIIGSSVGGGQILIRRIDDLNVEFSAQSPALIIRQSDEKGVIFEITRVLSAYGINIGVMKVSRVSKGDSAITVIETDDTISDEIVRELNGLSHVLSVQALNL